MGTRPGTNPVADGLLERAKGGDAAARDQVIRDFTSFILRVSSQAAGHYLRPGVDDEFSIGLMAFNEAIDGYEAARGSFISFAQTVIRRRIIDYYRRRPHQEVLMTDLEEADEEGHTANLSLDRAAQSTWRFQQEENERRQQIEEYQSVLREFGISFEDLVTNCPKHRDARERVMQVARDLASHEELAHYLLTRRELPLKRLGAKAWISRKTLERHRKYIIAVSLILLHDWPLLKAYVAGPEREGA